MKFARIDLDVDIPDKDALFRYISEAFRAVGVVADADAFYDALMEREAHVSTGLVEGMAIPHGKSTTVLANEAMVVRLRAPIAYETLDGSDVTVAFGLAIAADRLDHVETLSELSVKLMEDGLVDRLKRATTAEQIAATFA